MNIYQNRLVQARLRQFTGKAMEIVITSWPLNAVFNSRSANTFLNSRKVETILDAR